MTPVREAVLLPLVFLTVALLGGLELRGGTDPLTSAPIVAWIPPSLFSLVLAVLLLGAFIRSGTLSPERLMHGTRSGLENANGLVVLASLFAASAQLLQMLMPREGLPLLIGGTLLLVLLVNTLAAAPNRISLLRSLAVMTGAAFLIKFVVLAALSNPEGGTTKRLLLAIFDAATLGTITQAPQSPASGYLAFFLTLAFVIAVATLPSSPRVLTREITVIEPPDL